MIRIHSIHFIKGLGAETPDPQNQGKTVPAAVSKDVVNRHFAEVLLSLAEDPVPNIRFNVSKTMWALYPRFTPGNKIKCEGAIKKMCNDSDFDAQYFAKQTMAKIG